MRSSWCLPGRDGICSQSLDSYYDKMAGSRGDAMPPPSKLDGRRQRSAHTRARIIDTATRLFLHHGYLPTTIEAVAEQAGVAVQTVYYVFGTKPKLLAAVLDVTIAGDPEPLATLQRPW